MCVLKTLTPPLDSSASGPRLSTWGVLAEQNENKKLKNKIKNKR
jgi:hypothetical protein